MLDIRKYDIDIYTGEAFNVKTNYRLKATIDSNGYPVVGLCYNRKCVRNIHIHRFVAVKVWGIDKIKGKQIGHINGIRHESHIGNLWLPETIKEHVYHDGTHNNLILGRQKTKEHWEPCIDCGDINGRIEGGNKTPDRISGKRFGIEGELCRRCYRKHSEREYRKKKSKSCHGDVLAELADKT